MHWQYIPLFRSWGQYRCILTPTDWFDRRKTGVVLTLVQESYTTNSSSGATAVPVPRRKKIVLVLYNPGLTWIRWRRCTLWTCNHEAVLLLQPWVIYRCVISHVLLYRCCTQYSQSWPLSTLTCSGLEGECWYWVEDWREIVVLNPGVDYLLVGAEEVYAEPGGRARYSQTRKQIPSWSSELWPER